MAGSHTSGPVTVTVGAAWTFQLDPRPQPHQTSLATGIICLATIALRLAFGVGFYGDCPQEPNIPVYLIGMAVITLLGALLMMHQRSAKPSSLFSACLVSVVGLCACVWIVAGNARVFLAYQPNYDPTAADGLYCNKTLYTFALWNAVWETLSFVVITGRMCRGMLLGVTVRPVAADGNFYGYV